MDETESPSRRGFLTAGLAGMTSGVLACGANACGEETAESKSVRDKVRYAELRPDEFRARLAACPIAYLPLGTLEWHGEHLPLGADAIQSEELMVECARRFGGIVMPPIHLGSDRTKLAGDGTLLIGMDFAAQTTPPRQLAGSCYWVSKWLHVQIVEAILDQLKRAGFRAVFADGHGPSRTSWAENIQERQARYGMRLFGITEDILPRWKSQVDHAARNETSLMMHYRPDLVDLSRLPESRDEFPQGVGGDDPRDATAAYGAECAEESVKIVGELLSAAGLL